MRHLLLIFAIGVLLSGCYQGQPSQNPPVKLERNMFDQPRYDVQAKSMFFADSANMRVPPEGTVAHGWLRDDSIYYTGMERDTFPIKVSPVPVTLALLQRGQGRFNIYCSPCHSRIGDGQGMIVQRGLPPPPSFHDPRIIEMPDGHYFDVITNGIRNMPPYKYQIPVDDRWAIVAYLRALQRSEKATINDLPVGVKGTLK